MAQVQLSVHPPVFYVHDVTAVRAATRLLVVLSHSEIEGDLNVFPLSYFIHVSYLKGGNL